MIFNNISFSIGQIDYYEIDVFFKTLIIFLITLLILRIFKFVIIKKLKKIAEKTATKYDDILIDMVDKIGWSFYVLISLYISFYYFQSFHYQSINVGGILLSDIKNIIYYIIIILTVYYVVKAIHALIDYGTQILIKKRERNADISEIDLLNKISKGVLWLIAIILTLSNLGYNVSTLIAGLGIGGVAIAFALQSILGDIFASFSIYLDRPFRVGDYILFEDIQGTVKKIGIKSTRIEALQGQEIVVSNKQLTETVVNNYKKMDYRRVLFNISVKYETDIKKLEKIPEIIKYIINNTEMTRFGRAHFSTFGDFGYTFEVVYYVNSSEYDKYMDVQQIINFGITKKFENEGIEISIPTYLQTKT